MTPKDPFLEGTFWDKSWRPIRSRALLFTPEIRLRSQTVRGDCFWEIGCDFSAVTIRLRRCILSDEKWQNWLLAAEIPCDFACDSKNR